MKQLNPISFGLIALCFVASCDAILVKDISKETVQLRIPSDSLATSQKSQQFWWDVLGDASKYRLTIVSPDLQHAQRLALDTLISKNVFSFTLDTGRYEWCVRAENSSYQTVYSCRVLRINK